MLRLDVVRKGGDYADVVRFEDKHPRQRISDYMWRAEIRTAVGGDLKLALTDENGGLTIVDDLGGDMQISIGHDDTADFEGGTALNPRIYVLDLRGTNKTTGRIEFSDVVELPVVETVTQAP